jgi:hypothetical protein
MLADANAGLLTSAYPAPAAGAGIAEDAASIYRVIDAKAPRRLAARPAGIGRQDGTGTGAGVLCLYLWLRSAHRQARFLPARRDLSCWRDPAR